MDCSTAVQLVLDQLIAPTVASEGTEGVRRLIRMHLAHSAINTLEITGIGLETGNPLMKFVGVLEQHLLVDLRTPTAIKLLTAMLDTITMRNGETAPTAGPKDEKDPAERCPAHGVGAEAQARDLTQAVTPGHCDGPHR